MPMPGKDPTPSPGSLRGKLSVGRGVNKQDQREKTQRVRTGGGWGGGSQLLTGPQAFGKKIVYKEGGYKNEVLL